MQIQLNKRLLIIGGTKIFFWDCLIERKIGLGKGELE